METSDPSSLFTYKRKCEFCTVLIQIDRSEGMFNGPFESVSVYRARLLSFATKGPGSATNCSS